MGDMVPMTTIGKAMGCVTMISGMVIVSISVAVVTTHFTEVYRQKAQHNKIQRVLKEAKHKAQQRRGSGNTHLLIKGEDVFEEIIDLEAQAKQIIDKLEAALKVAFDTEVEGKHSSDQSRCESAAQSE